MNHSEKISLAGLSEVIDLGFIDAGKAKFYKTDGGFVGLSYNGENYSRISLRRSMPLADPDSYISVAYSPDGRENKEICLIRSIDDLSSEQRAIVLEELGKRYYSPEVKEISSVKDKMGYLYMEMVLIGRDGEDFSKNCAIKDVNKNIRPVDDDRLIIFDVDGNRYIINSLKSLDKKSQRRLEPYVF